MLIIHIFFFSPTPPLPYSPAQENLANIYQIGIISGDNNYDKVL